MKNTWKEVSVEWENFRRILLNDKMFLHFDIQFHCTVMIWKSNLEKSSIFLKFKCSWNKQVSLERSVADVFQNSFSYKFCNIHRKTPLLKSISNNVAGVRLNEKDTLTQVFPVNITKFSRTTVFCRTPPVATYRRCSIKKLLLKIS